MNLTDFIIIAAVAVILTFAIGYIVKAKKRGTKCIGCPYGHNCPSYNKDSKNGCDRKKG